MKKLKEINLVDKYMNPADIRFYTGPLNKKTKNKSLIIVDDMDQVIDYIDDFLYNPIMNSNRNGHVFDETHYNYGVSIGLREDIDETNIDAVFPLLFSDVLDHINESSTCTRFSQLKKLIKIIKEY